MRLRIAACVLLLALSACAHVYQQFDILYIRGEIKPGDSEKFDAALLEGAKRIVIESEGGNAKEAIKLADAIHESKLPVEVRRFCISACANYLVPSAARVQVKPGGFLAFHAGTEGWLKGVLPFLREHKGSTPAENLVYQDNLRKLLADYQVLSEASDRIHRQAVLAPWFTDVVFQLTALPIDSVTVDEAERHVEFKAVKRSRCEFWVPDADGLAEIGLRVPGYERPDKKSIASTLNVPVERIFWGQLSTARSASSTGICEES